MKTYDTAVVKELRWQWARGALPCYEEYINIKGIMIFELLCCEIHNLGRVTHDTVFWPFWYENTVTGEVRSTILCILNYFGLHVSLLTFMSWNFTCLVWNWATIFGAVSKRPCQQAYFVTPQYPYTTLIFLEVLVLGDTFQGGYGYVLEPPFLRIKISDR